jgi:hypothetical protein
MSRANRAQTSPRAERSRPLIRTVTAILFALIAMRGSTARAFPYSDFFTPANPQHLSLTLFASSIGAESLYAATHEGFQLEQTLNPYIGVVGRVSGYQIYQGDGSLRIRELARATLESSWAGSICYPFKEPRWLF